MKPAVRDAVSTALDVVGLLAVAAGVTAGAWPYVGGWSIAAGGLVVLAMSFVWGRPRGGDS